MRFRLLSVLRCVVFIAGGREGILHGEFILDCTFGHRIRDDVLGAMDLIDGNMLVAISRFPLS